MDVYEQAFRVTIVLLAASVIVIAPGVAGFGGSPLFVGLAFVIAGALYAISDVLGQGPKLFGHDLGEYGRVLWLSPIVAAVVFSLGLGATPGELRALGGIVGLAGMANYFLRPVYLGLRMVIRTVVSSAA